MPLLAASPIAPPPVEPPVVVAPIVPTRPQLTLTGTDGKVWSFDGTGGVWLGPERLGFHSPDYTHHFDLPPAVPGGFYRGSQVPPRELFVRVVVLGADAGALADLRNRLIASLLPLRGTGLCKLTVTYPNRERRSIDVRYVDGLAGIDGPGENGITSLEYGIRFLADDPFFYGDPITREWAGAPTREEFPIPGADGNFEVVTAELVLGETSITNPGQVEAYPEWDLSGPFTSVTASHGGKSFTVTYTATTTSDGLVIHTKPGATKVVDRTGANRFDKLSTTSELWPLAEGAGTVTVTLAGANPDTRAEMTYKPRFLGS